MKPFTRTLTRVKPQRIIKPKYLKPINTTISPVNKFHTTTSKMSMFGPRFYSSAEPNFTGLFRLIDDFDRYAGQNENGAATQQAGRQHARHLPTFTPKFDLKETENNYELHGELPGIEKDQVHIEFTDQQTIVVRGRVERTYTSGTPPAGLLEKGQDESKGAIADAPKEQHHEKAPKPTVEDAPEDGNITTTVAETNKNKAAAEQPKQPQHRFWVSERSVGEFSRTFQFPSRVDTDNVSASLNNGILSVVVPKAKKPEGRRVFIN
ncbi:HSP20-like chaperone [Daldinia decipiens]|uniref:HSP20-like chaperone n=1 Tax=Daldinia decipiens TaxID=326647 RepID=UPI0020C3693B|nr:HSP20-like chaperone [Daldinia decipiens]KAI1659866.1 HSP20-like chaperone [Daldinia decipiens]